MIERNKRQPMRTRRLRESMIERNKRQSMRNRRFRENKVDEIYDNFLHQIKEIFENRKREICNKLMPSDYAEELSKIYLHNGSSYDRYYSFNSGYVKLRIPTCFNDLFYSSQRPKILEDWLKETRTREESYIFEDFCEERGLKVKSPSELSEEDYMDYEEEFDNYFDDFEVEATVLVMFTDPKKNGSYECHIESWYDFQTRDTYKSKTLDISVARLETENGREAILGKIEKYILSVCDLK